MLIQYTSLNTQRRKTFFAQILNICAYLTQSVHQLTYRTVVHTFHTLKNNRFAIQLRTISGKEAHGGSTIAEVNSRLSPLA
jgi:hypothetical protein